MEKKLLEGQQEGKEQNGELWQQGKQGKQLVSCPAPFHARGKKGAGHETREAILWEKMKRSSNKELKYSTDVLTQLYEHILFDKINVAWCILSSLATNYQIIMHYIISVLPTCAITCISPLD